MADPKSETDAARGPAPRSGRTDPDVSRQSGTRTDRTARVSSREALRFLTRAGRALARSLDYDETLRRVVRFAIPRIACFAAIDVLRADGLLERVAYGHVDPSKRSLLERPEPFAPRERGWIPLTPVLREGRSLLIERVEDLDEREEVDEDLLRRVRSLDGRSVILVPLTARDQRLGVVVFGSTRTDRFYGPRDLALAEELARTAALAIDNARLYGRAEAAVRARDEVLSVVSHDLRNPLQRVGLATQMLIETGSVASSGHSMLQLIQRASDEMNRLIGDLLDVSRIEAGRLSLSPEPVPLGALMRRIDEEFAPVAESHGLTWRVERPEAAPTLELDEHRIRQALGNLIGNAFKFTPSGGTVTIALTPRADGTTGIAVRDTGEGMAPEQVERVFDRFWQAGRGDRRGAGLGLAIAHGIVTAHGGDLEVESEPGRGSVFTMVLPASPGEAA